MYTFRKHSVDSRDSVEQSEYGRNPHTTLACRKDSVFLLIPSAPPFFSSSSPLLLSGTSADLTQAPKIDPEEQLFKEHMFELTSQVNKTNRFVGFFDFRPHLLSPSKRVFLPLLPGPLSPSSHLATCLCRRRCRFGGAALQCTYRSLNQQQ